MTTGNKALPFIIMLILDSFQIIVGYILKSVPTSPKNWKVRNFSELFKVETGYYKRLAISLLLSYSFSKEIILASLVFASNELCLTSFSPPFLNILLAWYIFYQCFVLHWLLTSTERQFILSIFLYTSQHSACFPFMSEVHLEPSHPYVKLPEDLYYFLLVDISTGRYTKKEMGNISLCCQTQNNTQASLLYQWNAVQVQTTMTSISWNLSILSLSYFLSCSLFIFWTSNCPF